MGLTKGNTGNNAGFIGGGIMKHINLSQKPAAGGGGIPPVQGLDFVPIAQNGNFFVDDLAYPLTKWYSDSYGAYIITAAEMGGAKTLDGVALWKEEQPSSIGNTVYDNAWIKIAHTTDTEFPSGTTAPDGTNAATFSVGNLLTLTDETLVLTATNLTHTSTVNAWTSKIAFDTNFEYNGTDNLVILFYADTPSWTSIRMNYGADNTTASTNKMYRDEADGTSPWNMTGAKRASIRPATKLYY